MLETSTPAAERSVKDRFLELIEKRTATVGIIGLGYVGLTLGAEMARFLKVIGFEVDKRKIESVNAGKTYIEDVSDEQLSGLVKGGHISATGDFTQLRECDAIIICTPTPLRRSKEPDVSYIVAAGESIAANQRPGQLIILESTTYPGTTDELLLPMLERGGLVMDVDFLLAFSPERVDPGNPTFTVRNVPKVVGGVTADATEAAAALYALACDHVHVVSSSRAAEATKLLENTFRHVNIALVNEFARLCRVLAMDPWEVIGAAATKPFGYMAFYPGPGVGGHCIPLDPLYLTWKARQHGFEPRFINIADQVNSAMPQYVVDLVADALNMERKPISNSKILVLGVAYKRDIGDMRESAALPIIQLLRAKGGHVDFHDPHVASIEFDPDHHTGLRPRVRPIDRRRDRGATHAAKPPGAPRRRSDDPMHSVDLTDDALAHADCVVIHTDHAAFDYERICEKAKLIVDTRNAVSPALRARAKARVVTL
jgi:UDP-N-acetyl-D-glucosamine dehydrogenase